jgi:hypothetical protein
MVIHLISNGIEGRVIEIAQTAFLIIGERFEQQSIYFLNVD